MNTEEIKKFFIELMEEKHADLIFPKSYLGCLMAVLIENQPVTQERIKVLTNYSPTTISQMLKIIEVNFPLRKIAKSGERKKFYLLDISPTDFMVDFLLLILDSYKERVDFIPPLIKEVEPYLQKHPRFSVFHQYLTQMYNSSITYMALLSNTTEELRNLLKTGQEDDSTPLNQKRLRSLTQLNTAPSASFSIEPLTDQTLLEVYQYLKTTFYRLLKENITGSQAVLNRMIIGTELLLEQRPVTQQEIEVSTLLQRSTISDTLNTLLERQMVQLVKKPRDRKKYYQMIQSWETRMISRLKLNIRFAINMKMELAALRERIEIRNEEDKSLFEFLTQIHYSYVQLERYYISLTNKYLINSTKSTQEF